jgi:hypothetical protein
MLWSQKRKEKKKVLKGGGKVLVHAPFHRMRIEARLIMCWPCAVQVERFFLRERRGRGGGGVCVGGERVVWGGLQEERRGRCRKGRGCFGGGGGREGLREDRRVRVKKGQGGGACERSCVYACMHARLYLSLSLCTRRSLCVCMMDYMSVCTLPRN